MAEIYLVIFDCDRTLWDHYDISILKHPFKKIGSKVQDAEGVTISLNENVEATIRELYNRGYKLGVATFNIADYAIEILRLFGLLQYFHYIVAEYHPFKERMIAKIIDMAKVDLAKDIEYSNVLMIDDNEWTVKRLKEKMPGLRVLQYGKDIVSINEIFRHLS
jgi:magnesium-dependent phosphatase-1